MIPKNRKSGRIQLLPGQGFYIAATVLLAGSVFVALLGQFVNISLPFSYPCLLKEWFHIYCPGCGGTRAVGELFRFHVLRSFLCNPIVVYLTGLFLYYYIGTSMAVIRKGRKRYFRPGHWMWITGIGILVINTLLRNYLAIFRGMDYLGDIAKYWR